MKILIDSNKLQENINIVKNKVRGKNIIAVVKSNGYGLGINEYIKTLVKNGIDFFATTSVDDAIYIKQNNVCDVMLLESVADELIIEKLIENNITITLGTKSSIESILKVSKRINKKCKAHLLFDTGFGITGIESVKSIEKLVKQLENSPEIDVEGAFSHFTNSYNNKEACISQINKFKEILEELKKYKFNLKYIHIHNSHAVLQNINIDETAINTVRIGSAFVGIVSPKYAGGLEKVASLETQVVDAKKINSRNLFRLWKIKIFKK
jgi:alanine racemase